MTDLSLPVKRKQPYKRTSPEDWMKAKADYESGKFTVQEIADKYDIKVTTVFNKIQKKNWVKGKDLPVIQGNIQEQNRQRLVALGMAPEDALKLLIDGMTKPEVVVFEGKGENMMATTQPDYKTRLAYLQEYNKITGQHQQEKDTGSKHLHLHLTPEQMKDMNAKDAINAYQNWD